MTTINTTAVGRIWVPEPVTFLPGGIAGHRPGHRGVVTFQAFDGGSGKAKDPEWGFAQSTLEGVRDGWRALGHKAGELDAMLADLLARVRRQALVVGANERVNNGGALAAVRLFGVTAATAGVSNTGATNAPGYIGLASASFTTTTTHLSLGSASANVTTNEFIASGLSRTGALSPTGWTAETALDSTAQIQFTNSFTCSAGPQTIFGTASFDNTVTAFNMFAEYLLVVSQVLQTNDQAVVTWTHLF